MSIPLSDLKPQQQGTICKVAASGTLRRRMTDMGLISGTPIKVVRTAPMGDPIEYLVRGYSLSLRRSEAALITVDMEG